VAVAILPSLVPAPASPSPGLPFSALHANWIVRAEYLHYGFGGGDTNTVAFNPPQCDVFGAGTVCGQTVTNSSNRVDVGRLGLSYKF
jgi:opacity protein-like surface antigen